jgi:hypothetical protein
MRGQTEKQIEKQKERKSLAARSKIDFATHIVQISSAVKNAKKVETISFCSNMLCQNSYNPFLLNIFIFFGSTIPFSSLGLF